MTTPAKDNFEFNSVSASMVSLSIGALCDQERAKLLHSILANPDTATLAKLALRVSSPAQLTASSMVSAANTRKESTWSARNWVTGACASLALVAIFSFSSFKLQNSEAGPVAMNQAQSSDHFGPPGSFEGVVASNKTQLIDSFGNGGFEAD